MSLPVEAYFPDGRSFVPDDLSAQAKAQIEKAEADLKKAREKPEAPPVIAAAEKRLEAAKAALPALEARIKADLAAMATPVPPEVEQLAEEARKLERAANYLKADADVTLAKYELEQAATNEKKLGAATTKLEAAVKALKEPAEGYTPIGPKYPTTSTRTPARARPLDRGQGQSANRSCRDQSHLAAPLRKAACPDGVQLRQKRQTAIAPGTARLARGGVHGS